MSVIIIERTTFTSLKRLVMRTMCGALTALSGFIQAWHSSSLHTNNNDIIISENLRWRPKKKKKDQTTWPARVNLFLAG